MLDIFAILMMDITNEDTIIFPWFHMMGFSIGENGILDKVLFSRAFFTL